MVAVRSLRSRVPKKLRGSLRNVSAQADSAGGALLVGRKIQRGILEIVQKEEQEQNGRRRAGIDENLGGRIAAGLQSIQQILECGHYHAHGQHQADVAEKAPHHGLDKVPGTLFT